MYISSAGGIINKLRQGVVLLGPCDRYVDNVG